MWKKYWLIVVAIFTLPLLAQVAYGISEVSRRYTFFDNKGGLNDKSNPVAVEDNQATGLQNVVFSTDGAVLKRKGYAQYSSTNIPGNEALTGLFYYRKSNGDSWLVETTTNSNVFTSTNVAGGLTKITGTASWIGGNDVQSTFDVAQDILVFTTGDSANKPWKWEPSGAVGQVIQLGGSPPKSTMLKFFKNHLFAAGDPTAQSTLYFSNLGAIELWDSGDAINVDTNDGSPITALWIQLDGLYIGKRQAIFRLDGTSRNDFQLHKLVEGIGPINQQSVQVIENQAYFSTPNGHVYRYDGGINAERLSDRITTTISGLNNSRLSYSTAGVRDREYWLSTSASGSATNNRVIMYDLTTDSWTVFTGINANTLAWAYDPNGVLQFYSGGYNGVVYKQRTGNNDDGQAISAYWQSKVFRFPELGTQKILRRIKVVPTVEGNWNLTMEVRSDFQTTGTTRNISLLAGGSVWNTMVWNTDKWGGSSVFVSDQPALDKIAEFFQIVFSNANADEPFTVRGYMQDVEPTGRP